MLGTTTPDFWTAIFTGGLLIVAIATAWIGLVALAAAHETARLEATPFLVVKEGGPGGKLPDDQDDYVFSLPVGCGVTPTLRPREYATDEPKRVAGALLSSHYRGRPDWPRRVIAITNVGRSPAVSVRVEAIFRLEPPSGLCYDALAKQPRGDDANPAP